MNLLPNQIYHVYNRGNNRQPIFLEKENYYYFLEKVRTFLVPNCHILAFSLMPNHFHFLICPNERSNIPYYGTKRRFKDKKRKKQLIKLNHFTWGLKHLLSSYSRGINKRFNRTGSLFQQNTKIKLTSSDSFAQDYSLWCFIYIHNNSVSAGLVNSPDEYEFTSYRDFLENREDSICNLALARELLSFDLNKLFEFKSIEIPDEVMSRLFKRGIY